MKSYKEANDAIQVFNSTRPEKTDQSRDSYREWRTNLVEVTAMKLYRESYRQEFTEVGHLLGAKVPDAANPFNNYEDPVNMAGVMAICAGLAKMTEAYIEEQYAAHGISPEDKVRHLRRMKPMLQSRGATPTAQ